MQRQDPRRLERFDHLGADGGGLGVGDVVAADGGEELLVLDLHALPRRVADDAGEPALPAGGRVDFGGAWLGNGEDAGELQVPVEEAVLLGQFRARSREQRRGTLSGFSTICRSVSWVMPWPVVGRLGLDERRAPGVGGELSGGEVGVVFQAAPCVGAGAGLREGRCAACLRARGPCWSEPRSRRRGCRCRRCVSWSASRVRSALLRALSLLVQVLSSSPRAVNAASGMLSRSRAGVVPSRALPTLRWASRKGNGREPSKASSQSATLVISMARSLRSTP